MFMKIVSNSLYETISPRIYHFLGDLQVIDIISAVSSEFWDTYLLK